MGARCARLDQPPNCNLQSGSRSVTGATSSDQLSMVRILKRLNIVVSTSPNDLVNSSWSSVPTSSLTSSAFLGGGLGGASLTPPRSSETANKRNREEEHNCPRRLTERACARQPMLGISGHTLADIPRRQSGQTRARHRELAGKWRACEGDYRRADTPRRKFVRGEPSESHSAPGLQSTAGAPASEAVEPARQGALLPCGELGCATGAASNVPAAAHVHGKGRWTKEQEGKEKGRDVRGPTQKENTRSQTTNHEEGDKTDAALLNKRSKVGTVPPRPSMGSNLTIPGHIWPFPGHIWSNSV